jgi:hypothetical protein
MPIVVPEAAENVFIVTESAEKQSGHALMVSKLYLYSKDKQL